MYDKESNSIICTFLFSVLLLLYVEILNRAIWDRLEIKSVWIGIFGILGSLFDD